MFARFISLREARRSRGGGIAASAKSRRIRRSALSIGAALFVVFASTQAPAEVVPTASKRFAGQATSEVPSFQKHVVPLLGRLGCNGRACHGSFQGRGGFRLSLFGYDFEMDHAALMGEAVSEDGLRVNVDAPNRSLAVRKPVLETDHEGGQRFEQGSWEHQLLKRWIEGGALGVAEPLDLDRLTIEPAEVVFGDESGPTELRVIATWKDGSREDVTSLCRFRSNDDAVATVDRDGQLQSTGHGDTHVIAFYDNGVVSVPVIKAVSQRGEEWQDPPTPSRIDQLVQAKLRKLGIVPSGICSDAEFLRRVSIDLTGTLPTPDEIETFLADRSASKRQLKIDELLARPAYAAWWSNKLCDFTGCNPNQQAELGQETSVQWYMWIYDRLKENVPYDELIERIVLARGRRKGQSYDEYAREFSAYFKQDSSVQFSSRQTMPHYWSRQSLKKPEDKALAFAHSFLGIRLQCAQCHKHPFAPWTKSDFEQFSDFFENVKYGVVPASDERYRELAKEVGLNVRGKDGSPIRPDILKQAEAGRTVPWRELYIDRRSDSEQLSLLRSGMVRLAADEDPREAIMQWMKLPDNPWFARAFVNRVWAGYFHVGIVDPPDDLNPANPPSHPELLRWLATSFVENGYDMKWLHRQVTMSATYQRTWRPNATNREDHRNFSRRTTRRLPAEVVYDGVKQAVAGSGELHQVREDLSRRAIGHLSMRLSGTYAMDVFGKPDRAVNCDCERVNQPTLLQAVFLQNDPLIDQRLQGSGWVAEIAVREQAGEVLDVEQLIREAWLRTVGRPPDGGEVERALRHLTEAESTSEGVRDLLWALINTKEFILNH